MFGQFKLSCLITYKKTEIAIDQKNRNSYCVMQPWLEVVIESPKKFLGSNEVNLETQISGDCAKIWMFNVHLLNTADKSPWQNGLCDHDHSAVESVLEKIIEDHPLKIAFSQSLMQKVIFKCGVSSPLND